MAYGIRIRDGSNNITLDTTNITSRVVYQTTVTIVSGALIVGISVSSDYTAANTFPMTDKGAYCYFTAAGAVTIDGSNYCPQGVHTVYLIATG